MVVPRSHPKRDHPVKSGFRIAFSDARRWLTQSIVRRPVGPKADVTLAAGHTARQNVYKGQTMPALLC